MNRLRQQTECHRSRALMGPERGRARQTRAGRRHPGSMLEALEDRRPLATLDITGGALTYSAAGSAASSLMVSIDPSNTADALFTDTGQTIALGAGATG